MLRSRPRPALAALWLSGLVTALGMGCAPAVDPGKDAADAGPEYPSVARVLVLGDSISTGTGASEPDVLSYYALLYDDDGSGEHGEPDDDLKARFGEELLFRQLAQGGATSGDFAASLCTGCDDNALQGLFESRETWPPEGHTVVVMTIGGNDLGGRLLAGDYTGAILDDAIANLRSIVGFLQDPAHFPDGTSIFVASIYDPSDGEDHASGCLFDVEFPGISEAIDVWHARYEALSAELGFTVVDATSHFRGHGWNYANPQNPFYDEDDPSLWFSDCIHPNDRGHHELRRLFRAAIDEALRR